MISELGTDEWIYSQSQHNLVENSTGFIDGGRKYVRRGGDLETQEHAVYKVLDGEFVEK